MLVEVFLDEMLGSGPARLWVLLFSSGTMVKMLNMRFGVGYLKGRRLEEDRRAGNQTRMGERCAHQVKTTSVPSLR